MRALETSFIWKIETDLIKRWRKRPARHNRVITFPHCFRSILTHFFINNEVSSKTSCFCSRGRNRRCLWSSNWVFVENFVLSRNNSFKRDAHYRRYFLKLLGFFYSTLQTHKTKLPLDFWLDDICNKIFLFLTKIIVFKMKHEFLLDASLRSSSYNLLLNVVLGYKNISSPLHSPS